MWKDKPAAITGKSPGAIGTALAQAHLRLILGILGCTVVSGEAYIQFKSDLIDDAGYVSVESARNFMQVYVDVWRLWCNDLRSQADRTSHYSQRFSFTAEGR